MTVRLHPRILILCLSILLVGWTPQHQQGFIVRVGYYENPPKLFQDAEGNIQGFWPDLVNAIAEQEGWTVIWVPGTWKENLARLENGEIDIMPDVAWNPQRNQIYSFADTKILVSWSRLYASKDSNIETILDLEGKTIAGLSSSVNYDGPEGIKDLVRRFDVNATFVDLNSYTEVFEAIQRGSVDASITNKDFGNQNERNYSNLERTSFIFQPTYITFAFPKEGRLMPNLIEIIDGHMKSFMANNDSIYYQSLGRHLEQEAASTVTVVELIPGWVKNFALFGGGAILFLLAVGIVSRVQVKRRTAELQENQTLLQTIVDSTTDAIFVKDANGRYTLYNAGAEKSVGKHSEDVLGQDDHMVFPQFADMVIANDQRIIAGGNTVTYEEDLPDANGKLHTYLTTKGPIHDKHKNFVGLFGIARDITERKKTENEIRLLKEFNETLINNMGEGIMVQNAEGYFTFVNPTAMEITGYPADEILGAHWTDFFPVDQQDIIKTADTLRLSGKPSRYEADFIHKSGDRIRLLISGSPLMENGHLNGTMAVFIDITERKKTEEALRNNEKILNEAQEIAGLGNYVLDLITGVWAGSVIFEKILGIDESYERTMESWPLIIHPEDRERITNHIMREVIGNQTILSKELRIIRQNDTEERWVYAVGKLEVDSQNRPIRLAGSIQDITERKQAQEILIQFREVMDESNDAIYMVDGLTGLYLDFNRVAYERLGYTKDELLQMNIINVAEHIPSMDAWYERVELVRQQKYILLESRYRRKDGTSFPVKISAKILSLGDRPILLAVVRDISERKQSETALQRHHEYLTALQKITLELLDRNDVNSLLLTICDKAATLLDSKHAFIFLDEGDSLLLRATSRDLTHHLDEREEKPGAGVLGQVWRTDQPVKVEHYETWELRDPNYSSDRLHSVAGVPILQGKNMIGVLVIARIEEDNRIFSDEEIDILTRFAELASLVLDNVSLYESALNEITEREKIEVALKMSEERYRILFEESPIAIWEEDFSLAKRHLDELQERGITDIRTYLDTHPEEISNIAAMVKVVDVNKASIKMYEAAGKEDLHSDLGQLLLPETLENFKEELIAIAENTPSISWDGRGRTLKGNLIDINVNWSVAPNSLDNYSRVIVSIINITERKRAEQIINQYAAELERRVEERTIELVHANRTKDEFLANMSHELRTPLNSILGFSETLLGQRRGPLNEKQEQYVNLIHSSGGHLLGLINDILEVSKIEAGKLDLRPDIDSVKEVCESSLNFVKEVAVKKSIFIEYKNAQSVHSLHADPQRLKQILVNLLNNAVKFTPQGGKVSLEVNLNHEKNAIRFSVKDNGIGIDPDHLPKLFTPFTQLDSSLSRQYEGTGLGLVLVLRLTELHGGSVKVESQPNVGSRFTIILPWSEQTSNDRNDLPVSTPPINGGNKSDGNSLYQGKILLVEDSKSNVLTIQEYLLDIGYDVSVSHDGAEAIAMAEAWSPNLILMDIQMPKMDGLEAIRRLRAAPKSASVPIIAVTALAMPGDRERCLEAGANEYTSKPLSLKNLVKTIQQLLPQESG